MFVEDGTGRELGFVPRDVVLVGYTGRDQAAVRHHVEELAAQGVPAPPRVPAHYRVTPDRVVSGGPVHVLGRETSGEAEFVLFRWEGELFVGVGSDHTDRTVERESVARSKQLCPKVVGQRVWRHSDVMAHWDHLSLRSFVGDGTADRLYQEGPVASLLDPEDVLAGVARRLGTRGPPDGLLVFCGTISLLGGFAFAPRFAAELADDEHDRRLRVAYEVRTADPLD